MLYRYENGGGGTTDSYGVTWWMVYDSSALERCIPWLSYGPSPYLYSAYSAQTDQAGGGPPTAPFYSTGTNDDGGTGWGDFDASPRCTSGCVAIAAGGH